VLLVERGDLDGLRARADAGDEYAARELADLLAECGDLDEAEQILRGLADAGDEYAARELSGLLIKQGRREEAERLRRFGLNPDGSIAWA
jgi:predicted negative regulator of RcsB-dependent stress response